MGQSTWTSISIVVALLLAIIAVGDADKNAKVDCTQAEILFYLKPYYPGGC